MLGRLKNQRRLFINHSLTATFSETIDQSVLAQEFYGTSFRFRALRVQVENSFKNPKKLDLLLYPTAVECSRSMPGPDNVNPFTA